MSEPDPLAALARVLDRAVRALAEAGEADAACRLAAEAWWLVREPCPSAARRLNATLHRLTVHPPKGERCPPTPTRSSTSAASRPRGATP